MGRRHLTGTGASEIREKKQRLIWRRRCNGMLHGEVIPLKRRHDSNADYCSARGFEEEAGPFENNISRARLPGVEIPPGSCPIRLGQRLCYAAFSPFMWRKPPSSSVLGPGDWVNMQVGASEHRRAGRRAF